MCFGDFRQYSRPVLWCFFFAAEHALMIIKFVVSKWFSERSHQQDLIAKQRDRVLDEWGQHQFGYEGSANVEKLGADSGSPLT